MAAFPFAELPFLVDCVITPEMMMHLSSSSSSPSSTTTTTTNSPLLSPSCCFSEDQSHLLNPNSNFSGPIFETLQFHYPYDSFHQGETYPIGLNLHESSCVEQGSVTPMTNSENELSLTPKKQSVTAWVPVKNKRKIKGDGSAPNPPKALRGEKSKKVKNCKDGSVKEEVEDEDVNKIKEKNKKVVTTVQEPPKGYIHVRARRGQATDSHSLAERVRREKISERMKFLQSLVPGCDKVTGKATMLDEIINYVQSLQSQVEFLSMKLSSVSPMVYSFGVDLDALLVEQQGLNNVEQQMPSVQRYSPTTNNTTQTQLKAPATAAPTTYFHCPPAGFQQVQCLEGNNVIGNSYWGLGDQGGPDPVSQSGFNNNIMRSF